MNSPQSARNDDADADNNMEAVFCRSLLIYLSICSGLSSSTQIHCSAVNHAHAARCSVSYRHPHITLCPEFLWLPQPAVAPNPPPPVMNDTPPPRCIVIYDTTQAATALPRETVSFPAQPAGGPSRVQRGGAAPVGRPIVGRSPRLCH